MPITKNSVGYNLTTLLSADKGGASFESVMYTEGGASVLYIEGGASFKPVMYSVGLENSTVNKLCSY